MKAIVITAAGGPEVLQLKEVTTPNPSASEVLIQIHAIGVNRSDLMTRENPSFYKNIADDSLIPGLEVAGEVIAVGDSVTTFGIGDRVCALVKGNGYAEYISVDAGLCMPIPEEFSYVEAASLPEALCTIWLNIFQLGKFNPSQETFLMHGGTSGVGILALQIAKAMSASVYTTVGSVAKKEFLNSLGITNVILYKETPFEIAIPSASIDVILDMVGGSYTMKNLVLLKEKGRLVCINGMENFESTIDIATIMSKQLTITGSMLKPQPLSVKHQLIKEVQEYIYPLLLAKKVVPILYKCFPLAEAAKAHQLMESSTHIGKIVLTNTF
ncbi:putative NAD(P)H quinone oxidoreductase, PIG3 family [Pustulibacterium marinum]|uniref:Putative NAD(P)H quinone oxidoreductase, PIG3 family n=1 Tax=Pustulibacterium marinum TaxID=1224947 RepID=A0A1I7H3A8_9FLAO|nr:NAD(P)H-quinone oxidoreductase [Pustulibacterium marinum]SFU55195.1 putative NAD(P)H quinone oxidoreductase, PIG3 family [Pustulibacterium marinum]